MSGVVLRLICCHGFGTSTLDSMHRTIISTIVLSALAFADGGGGLRWTVPSTWKSEPGARPMRLATYAVPAATGDQAPGECVVSYFGRGQGGSVEANLQRWTAQFQDASGQPVKNADVKHKTVHGLPVTTIDASGTYTGMGGPMMKAKTSQPGYRMLGAIVEGPEGSVFFKFTGPARTVAANQKAFEPMVASVAKQ
jgi:hypothetical protein